MGLGDTLSDLIESLWETAVQDYPESQQHKKDVIAAISHLSRSQWIEDNRMQLSIDQTHHDEKGQPLPRPAQIQIGAFRAMAKRRWASRSCGKDYTDTHDREDPISLEEAISGELDDDESDDE